MKAHMLKCAFCWVPPEADLESSYFSVGRLLGRWSQEALTGEKVCEMEKKKEVNKIVNDGQLGLSPTRELWKVG